MTRTQDRRPDFAILMMGVARIVADNLGIAVRNAGIHDMRPPYGFVIRALGEGGSTLTELAQLLGVTKQAAIKVVDEMESRGFLERVSSPIDGRSKILKLTEKSLKVRNVALGASNAMEHELQERIGTDSVEAMRGVLLEFLTTNAVGETDALAGRSRAVW